MITRLKRNKKQQEEFLASLEEQEDGGQIPDIMQRMPEDNDWLEDDLDDDEKMQMNASATIPMLCHSPHSIKTIPSGRPITLGAIVGT
jgi:hypothetical protein